MPPLPCIDSHLHCGIQNVNWSYERLRPRLLAAQITGAGLIPPVEDIYDRWDPGFVDTPVWQASRRQAQGYLLSLQDPDITLYPYFFVWNDFVWEELTAVYAAVKWHRHETEPEYHYDDPRCRAFIHRARELGLPILLEETLANTRLFLDELAPTATVIIPHLGLLNGGYRRLKELGIWERPRVYADTALADPADLKDYLANFGSSRLFFGSDYPFGDPVWEKDKVLSLGLSPGQLRAVMSDNWLELQAQRPAATTA